LNISETVQDRDIVTTKYYRTELTHAIVNAERCMALSDSKIFNDTVLVKQQNHVSHIECYTVRVS